MDHTVLNNMEYQRQRNFETENIPEDLKKCLRILQKELPSVLEDVLYGIYIYGSLSYGDFEEERSDVDVFVVTTRTLDAEGQSRLQQWYENGPLATSSWFRRLELDIANKESITSEIQNHLETIGFSGGQMRDNAHMEGASMDIQNIRDCGLVLYGPEPKMFISEIDPHLLQDALQEKFKEVKRGIEEWGSHDLWNQMYFTIQLCRIAYTLHENKPISKRAAARWCLEHLPTRFHSMIRIALEAMDDHEGPLSADIAQGLPKLMNHIELLFEKNS